LVDTRHSDTLLHAVAEPRSGTRTARRLLPPKPPHVERLAATEHPVHRAPQLGRQDAQRLLLAVLLLGALLPGLHRRATPDQQTHRLRESPLEMGVAVLLAAPADPLARRPMLATHQPGVRPEVAHVGEATEGVDRGEQPQRQDLA